MKILCYTFVAVLLLLVGGCNPKSLSGLSKADFETTIDGAATSLYTLKNARGTEACITNFGGRLVSLVVADRNGRKRDIVLGFDNIEDYRTIPSDFGASIGRYANRIDQGRFSLDGVEYQLPQNNFGHCLHGGPDGWQYRVYKVVEADSEHITLTLHSPDGDAGFPGTVDATVTYLLDDDNLLHITFSATTDRPTIVNMTNHSYFNLSGDPTATALGHTLFIDADNYTPCDSTFMTTGEIASVEGTPMDFRTPTTVGERINNFEFEQLRNGNGYDHNWVLNTSGDSSKMAARLYCPETGIGVEVYTNEPGIQIYAGNFLDGTVKGKHGVAYPQRASVCLETQHYPDSPNKLNWPSPVLRPNEVYFSSCTYKITVD